MIFINVVMVLERKITLSSDLRDLTGGMIHIIGVCWNLLDDYRV